jgi:hypothetical protein
MTSTYEDALLTKLVNCQGRLDTFCLKALEVLVKMCAEDDQICEYMYKCPPPTLQRNRFTDWFEPYLAGQKAECAKVEMTTYSYKTQRVEAIKNIEEVWDKFQEKLQKFAKADADRMEEDLKNGYTDIRDQWMAGENPDVAAHWPARIIVGKMVGDPKELMKQEDENIEVRLLELECEYMYSNPTGMFNLSMPDAMIRTANFTVHSYEQHKL